MPIAPAVAVAPAAAAGSGGAAAGAGGSARDAGRPISTPGDDVPRSDDCQPVASWPDGLASSELAMLDAINRPRSNNGSCRNGGACGARPLRMLPELRCSARKHSLDMAQQNYFKKTDPDGADPERRIAAAGLRAGVVGECIVQRASDANGALQQLLQGSDPDAAANFTDRRFDAIGIGRYDDLWTLDFASLDTSASAP